MAEKLNITSIEFEDIKTNLKDFLRSQSTFKDYDFEGSALSVLINLLSFNTYYNAYYMNMLANESFIDTAIVRNSLLSHAKKLNYTPTSRRAPTAVVDILVTPPDGNTQGSLVLDRFTEFQSESIDGSNYTFVTADATTIYKEGNTFPFTAIELKAGTPQTVTFTYDPVSNPRSEFEIPNDDIDTSTLSVSVRESSINTSTLVYVQSEDITDSVSTSAVYYLTTSINNKYKLIFGDGAISRAISNGNIVVATYLTCEGEQANRANSFASGAIGGFSNVIVTSVSAGAGGAEREEDESIRFVAPLHYTAQSRAVTTKDYEALVRSRYPSIQSIVVWGGEDNIPPVFGKVFISFAPKEHMIITETEKQRIINEIVKPIAMVTTTTEIVDPEYVYLRLATRVDVQTRLTTLSPSEISELVRQALLSYASQTLNQFGSVFISSKCGRAIDDTLPAIIGSATTVRMEKRIIPSLNVSATYNLSFETELHRSTLASSFKSTAFSVYDSQGILRTAFIEEVPDSFTGLDSIEITNAGYEYTSIPTVTITGDGTGATAVATVVNGRVTAVDLVSRGIGYTSALVFISGGGGRSAAASAILAAKYGTIKLIYRDSNAEQITLNDSLGTIDYLNGDITINDLRVVESLSSDGTIRLSVEPFESIVVTTRNQLLTVDQTDSGVITVDVRVR